jgi:pyruvate formate lyase activating enzyme
MLDTPPTPPATLRRAREIAMKAGLDYVYLGNVHDAEGDTTFCPNCKKPLIVRDWYQIERHALGPGGLCPACHAAIPGRFDGGVGNFGRRRIPVAIGL